MKTTRLLWIMAGVLLLCLFVSSVSACTASNDNYNTPKNTLLTIVAPGVLKNDQGTSLTAVKVSDPTHGTLTLNSNGGFTYTPTTGFSGTDSFTYKARSGTTSYSNVATVTITVTNQPPVLTPIGAKSVDEGKTLTFTATANDPNGDTLVYSATGLPTGASFDTGSHTFTWTPGFDKAPGPYLVTFAVSDGTLTASEVVTITVVNVNRPPVFGTISDQTVNENVLLVFTVSATDADNDPLSYSASNIPLGATFNKDTQTFEWTPGFDKAPGLYLVTFAVSDGTLTASEVVTITVVNVNRPPIFGTISDQTVNENVLLTFTVSATDADNDALTYSLVGAPQGAEIGLSSGIFTWTPGYNQGRTTPYTVTFSVSDGLGGSADKTASITVTNVNRPPVLDPIGAKSIDEGQPLEFSVSGSDPDGTAVTFSAAPLLDGAQFSGTTFAWTPGYDQAGDHTVTFTVSDGTDTDTEDVTITVTNVLIADFVGEPVDQPDLIGHDPLQVKFTDQSTGDIKTWSWVFNNEETSIVKDPPVQTFTADPTTGIRFYDVTLTVTDEKGASSTETKHPYITVSPLVSDDASEAVQAVENTLPGGSTEGVVLSASENPVQSESCITSFDGTCTQVSACNDLTAPVLVFIDNGYTKIKIEDPPGSGNLKDALKQANWYHDCSINYYCPVDKSLTQDPVPCNSPVTYVDNNGNTQYLTYADGEQANPEGLTVIHDPDVWKPVCQENCDKYYALLISGGINQANNHARYFNDIMFMYNTLIEYGYSPGHINVLMSDGCDAGYDRHISNTAPMYDDSKSCTYFTPGLVAPATRATVSDNLTKYAVGGAKELKQDETLFIFTTSHGGNVAAGATPNNNIVTLCLWGNECISDDDFVGYLNNINVGNITMVMEQCFGGGFKDEFINPDSASLTNANQKRVLITASDYNEPSWANGFSNAWMTGVSGHNRAGLPPWITLADTSPVDVRVSTKESYDYVVANNPATSQPNDPFALTDTLGGVIDGREHPQLWSKSVDPLTQFFDDCFAAPLQTITVLAPSKTGIAWPAYSQQYITWTYEALPIGTNVKIELLNDGVIQFPLIAESVPAQQQFFRWAFIPEFQAPGTKYKIKISTIDGAVSDTSDNTFEIKAKGAVGSLQVNCPTVTKATITVDGGLIGQPAPFVLPATPWETDKLFSNLRPGDYLVTVTPPLVNPSGYQAMTKQVTVTSGFRTTAPFTLSTASGKNEATYLIHVVSEPNDAYNAEIWIGPHDGLIEKVPGTTTGDYIATPEGTWDIYVTKDGWKTSGTQTVTVGPDNLEADVTFTLTPLNPVQADVLIVPQPLNIGRSGYFVAFVRLPTGYKVADVIAESVTCENVQALKLVRLKLFPRIFAAIFRREDMVGIMTPPGPEQVTMDVVGAIKQSGGNPLFRGSNTITVISKPVTTKEATDVLMTLPDSFVFTRFNKL
ncbi:MAG: Ig-like domain-containing protein [Methanoregula sp.]|nr:Ig-like domain-containing protein [Methanoregula sp.]